MDSVLCDVERIFGFRCVLGGMWVELCLDVSKSCGGFRGSTHA